MRLDVGYRAVTLRQHSESHLGLVCYVELMAPGGVGAGGAATKTF